MKAADLDKQIAQLEETTAAGEKLIANLLDEDAADEHPEIKKTFAREALMTNKLARHKDARDTSSPDLVAQQQQAESLLALEEPETSPDALLRNARFGPSPLPYPEVPSSTAELLRSFKNGKREFGSWEQAAAFQTVDVANALGSLVDEMSRLRVSTELKTYTPKELAEAATEAAATGNLAMLREIRRESTVRQYASDDDRARVGAAVHRAIKALPVPANVDELRAKFRQIRELSSRVREVRRILMGGAPTNDRAEIARIREEGPIGAIKSRREDVETKRQRVNAIVRRRLAGLIREKVA